MGIFGLATLYVVGCHDQVSTGSSCGGASPRFCTPSFGDPLGPGRLLLLVNSSEISDDQSDSKSNTPYLFRCKTSIVKEVFDMVIWVYARIPPTMSRLKHNLTEMFGMRGALILTIHVQIQDDEPKSFNFAISILPNHMNTYCIFKLNEYFHVLSFFQPLKVHDLWDPSQTRKLGRQQNRHVVVRPICADLSTFCCLKKMWVWRHSHNQFLYHWYPNLSKKVIVYINPFHCLDFNMICRIYSKRQSLYSYTHIRSYKGFFKMGMDLEYLRAA